MQNKTLPLEMCTGCSACQEICPVNAITLNKDKYGFLFPETNHDLCISCGVCCNVCHLLNPIKRNNPIQVFAAQADDERILKVSASGGVSNILNFTAFQNGYIVYGASMRCHDTVNQNVSLSFRAANNEEELKEFQGSKYFQSNLNDIYKDIQKNLLSGKKILFTGLPCQVAGLKKFLHKDFSNLITVDIFCHGNTNQYLFEQYFKYLEKKFKSTISDYIFRDKERGTGYCSKIKLRNGKIKKFSTFEHCYWYLMQYSKINMKVCYSCQYSSTERVGDISLGDFWGIEKTMPELINKELNKYYGISVILVNTSRGKEFLNQAKYLKLYESNLSYVLPYASALQRKNCEPENRKYILNLYKNGGYEKVKKYCIKEMGQSYYKMIIKDKIKSLLKMNRR